MPNRSQRLKEARELPGRPITNILPDTATIAAAGAVGRTVATLSITGGSLPVTYAIANAGGMSIALSGSTIVTTVNPCGTAGAKSVSVMATDSKFQTKTETITVTVT